MKKPIIAFAVLLVAAGASVGAFLAVKNKKDKEGSTGCKTVFDIAPAYLSPLSGDEIRAHLL